MSASRRPEETCRPCTSQHGQKSPTSPARTCSESSPEDSRSEGSRFACAELYNAALHHHTSSYPRSQYCCLMKFIKVLYSRAPCGWKKQDPGEIELKKKRLCHSNGVSAHQHHQVEGGSTNRCQGYLGDSKDAVVTLFGLFHAHLFSTHSRWCALQFYRIQGRLSGRNGILCTRSSSFCRGTRFRTRAAVTRSQPACPTSHPLVS
jgi:hypothetical protein